MFLPYDWLRVPLATGVVALGVGLGVLVELAKSKDFGGDVNGRKVVIFK